MIKIAIIATVAFAATNIDDAFVSLAFFANKKVKDAHILVGQYIGMAALVIAAMLLSAVSVVLLPNDLGLARSAADRHWTEAILDRLERTRRRHY